MGWPIAMMSIQSDARLMPSAILLKSRLFMTISSLPAITWRVHAQPGSDRSAIPMSFNQAPRDAQMRVFAGHHCICVGTSNKDSDFQRLFSSLRLSRSSHDSPWSSSTILRGPLALVRVTRFSGVGAPEPAIFLRPAIATKSLHGSAEEAYNARIRTSNRKFRSRLGLMPCPSLPSKES